MLKRLGTLARSVRRARLVLLMQGPRGLYRSLRRRLAAPPAAAAYQPHLLDLREPFEPLSVPECPRPAVSVLIPLHAPPRVTHHCLAALTSRPAARPFEVILVAAGSSPDPGHALRLWKGVRIIAGGGGNLASACDRAARAARGEHLVFLSGETQVQTGWLDALVDTFELRADAGIVGPRLLLPDGRLLAAGGTLNQNADACRNGYLNDPNRPEFSCLRAVDYCARACLAIRRDRFGDLGGFDASYDGSRYLEIDLALRVARAGLRVYIQPLARVVLGAGGATAHGTGECASDGAEDAHRARFLQRWSQTLARRGTEPPAAGRALVVDSAIPTPDRDSGSLRMVNLLAILQEEGFRITLAPMGLEAPQPQTSDLQKQGVECLYRPYVESIEEHLASRGAEYELVILSRVETAAALLRPARRWCPRAKVLFDTVDLHFQRIAREAAVRKDARMARRARRFKKQELAMAAGADVTLVVSEAERQLLARAVPGADVRVVSNIHRIQGSVRPFEERSDILFIGGFAHPPNTDAVLFFCREVFPLVSAVLPRIRFLVIGSDPPAAVAALADENVKILGYVRDADPFFDRCRLSVAPLRFGAGVKGKVNQSLARGLPVVATPVAAEGMFLVDGQSALIAEDAQGLARAVVRLYQEAALWNRLSRGGLAVMEEHFGFRAAREALGALVASCRRPPASSPFPPRAHRW